MHLLLIIRHMIQILLIIISFNWATTNDNNSRLYTYPENIEYCSNQAYNTSKEELEELWCSYDITMKYLRDNHPNKKG